MQFDNDIENCLAVLNTGGLILYPTDTIWGIGCDATNEKAVERIYSLKNRNEKKSMIVLLADEKDILKYVGQAHLTIFDYIKGIQKPTTMIYTGARNVAKNLINQDGSIGIRIVEDDFCRKLIKKFGRPIVSTSSNISGYPPPGVFSDIDIKIKKGVDYVVNHRQDDAEPGTPSTVVKVNDDGSYTVIRH